MSESLLELIEMANGDVALKRIDDKESNPEPIVTLKFSKSSLMLMQDAKMMIAQAMIEAGMAAYSDAMESAIAEEITHMSKATFH